MNSFFCPRTGLFVAVAAALMTHAQAQSTAPSSGAIQHKPARVDAALLPHGKCPANYRLEFVSSTWIRCKFNPLNAQTPKLPTHAAPMCDSGYTLQDAAASKAPERSLYRCTKA